MEALKIACELCFQQKNLKMRFLLIFPLISAAYFDHVMAPRGFGELKKAASESGRALNGRAADRSFCSAEQSRPRTLDRSKGRTSLFAELAPPQAGQAKMA